MKIRALLLAAYVVLSGCSETEQQQQAAGITKAPDITSGSAITNVDVSAQDLELASAPNLELGREVYNFRCYYCHGYSGNARTLAASFVTPKPRDFTNTPLAELSRDKMIHAVQFGRPGTTMMSFSSVIKPHEIEAVVDFIRQEFMVDKAENTRYHIEANGWFDHERYAIAFPFALGEIPLDTPWEELSLEQANGKRLFMSSCVTCHDRARVLDEGPHWESRPVSYPRNRFTPGDDVKNKAPTVDAMASASPYLIHERAPVFTDLTESERRGEDLFQNNCAFCHAADGTARNWIGSFMQPHPRNLTSSEAMSGMTRARLRNVIRNGLKGTSMPAWKSVLSAQQIEDVMSYVNRAFHPLSPEEK